MKKTIDRDKSLLLEIVRFAVIGVYATLIDFAVEGWVTSSISNKTEGLGDIPAFFVMFAISLIGFLVSTPANWSLTSIWGFRNVEKSSQEKARSFKGTLIFTFWSFLGLLLGAIIQFFGYMICLRWSELGINILGGFDFNEMFVQGHINVFFAWGIVLVIRTAVTMVFNYLTRKFFIYKAPKEEKTDE